MNVILSALQTLKYAFHFRRLVSLALILVMLSNSTWAAPQFMGMYADMAVSWQQELRFRYYSGGWAAMVLALWQGKIDDKPTKPQEKPQEKQEDRDAEVTKLEIAPRGEITLQTGEPIVFTALALTSSGAPVSGVKLKWAVEDISADKDKRKGKPVITEQGKFFSPIAGVFQVTVTGAKFQASANVTVHGNPQPPLDKLIEKYKPFSYGTLSTRDLPTGKPAEPQKIGTAQPSRKATTLVAQHQEPQPSLRSGKNLLRQGKPLRYAAGMATLVPAFQSSDPCGWNNANWTTADDSGKERGDMRGRSADGGAGSGNYEFAAPVIGLDSRGLDLSLALTYNSRLWHKANSNITFDIDHDWPAPGWNLGFGRIVSMGTDRGFMLIDGDGTRHGYTGNALAPSGWQYFNGKTIDGTFTDYSVSAYNGIPSSGSAQLANGATIYYGAANSTTRAVYPTQITDAQGNYITITYVSNQGPNIATVTDTMGRLITFNYTSGLLTEIVGPGLTLGSTRTLVRIEYKPHTLSYNFSLTPQVCSSTINVPKAIYYPATNTGYWFGDDDSYSGYGMITRIQECRNMSYSSGVISKHSNPVYISREMIYEYQTGGTLSAEPTYTKMKEKWAAMPTDINTPGITQGGADNGYAVTTFEVVDEASNIRRRTTITRPDGTKQVQYAWVNLGNFDDGLVFYAKTCAPGQSCNYSDMGTRASSISWQQGDYSSPRPGFIHAYDLPNQVNTPKLTTFAYGSYNQVTELQEWGYDSLKRKTVTTYENSANYINRHIFKLVKSVETRDANNVALSRTEYNYDEATPTNTAPASAAVTQHDYTYDTYTTQQICDPVYDEWGNFLTCNYSSVFNPATNYRGNVTTVKRYPNPGSTTGLVTETRAYDKTGNLITASTSCCEQTTFTYTQSTQFAYAETQTRGSASDPNQRVTTNATWNFRTGLMEQAKDANQLTTIYQYYADTLRPQYVFAPTGAYTHHVYDDTNLVVYDRVYFDDDLNANQFTMAVGSDKYLDGQGRVQGEVAYGAYVGSQYELDIVETKYDGLGRLWKQTRPFRNGTPVEQVAWSQVAYDALDRVTQTTEPDGSMTKRFYDEASRPSVASSEYGNTIRVQDQWGRERWARADWDGKLVEVVEPEPNATTNFGSVLNGTGYKTTYQYDVLGNLTQTLQGDQTRSFKYDGLQRMVAQKLAERSATLDDAGAAGSLWSDVFKYDDRSNLIERIDARQVKTVFDYQSDPLNRLKEVRYETNAANTSPMHAAATTTYAYEIGTNLDKTRLKTVTVASVVTDDLAYDSYGRINQVTRTFNDNTARPLLTNYLYDKADRVREITYPQQYPSTTRKLAKMNYDTASRYKEMLFGGQSFASAVSYNAESQATALKVGYNTGANEVKELYTYNPQNGLLTNQIVQKSTNSPLLNLTYDYT